MKTMSRDGQIVEAYDGEGRILAFLYENKIGRMILPILINPMLSNVAGMFLDSRLSKFLVTPFIKKNRLDLSDYPNRDYESFNDFFTRKIIDAKRTINEDKNIMISPCDGKLSLFRLEENRRFTIKGCEYTLDTLLRSKKLGEKYRGGWGVLLRLSVDDYHRYIYPVSGEKTKNYRIQGVYHSVNPRAASACGIYKENTREFTIIKSDIFGRVLMMEVGAMLVGRITNHHGEQMVTRGCEKGKFEFGGSSIILLFESGKYTPDEDLIHNSKDGFETIVKQGERIGSHNIDK